MQYVFKRTPFPSVNQSKAHGRIYSADRVAAVERWLMDVVVLIQWELKINILHLSSPVAYVGHNIILMHRGDLLRLRLLLSRIY